MKVKPRTCDECVHCDWDLYTTDEGDDIIYANCELDDDVMLEGDLIFLTVDNECPLHRKDDV